jgi:branched-chain amino acid transport system permease protein
MMHSSQMIRFIPWLIFAVIICSLPFLFNNPYFISIMICVALYGVLAVGMGVLMGSAGLFSLVGPTWFGLEAYIAGILSARALLSPSFSIIVAAASTALIAFLIGSPVLRLKGLYLACATFGILIITQISFVQLGDLTGGHSGLLGVPALKLFGFKFDNDRHYYFLSWALCFGCMLFLANIIKSRVGRAIISSHDSETASASL